MTSWNSFSFLVKTVCAASFIATIVGIIQLENAWRKADKEKEKLTLIILCPCAAIFTITFWGNFLLNIAIEVLF